jgi:nucleoside-diphosphate-sugar epimerase
MRVFVTGATGLCGTPTVAALIKAGHSVVGLVRSEESSKKLVAAGGTPLHGSIEDLDILKKGATENDGVIHLAFLHGFTTPEDFAKACAVDLKAVEAMGAALEGSNKPFVVTSGTLAVASGKLAVEDDKLVPSPRTEASNITISLGSKGVRSSVVRLSPTVHGPPDTVGFIPRLIKLAREKGVSGYIGDGSNKWPAVNVLDVGPLFALAVEKGVAGSSYHGVGDEGITTKEIAEVIGRHLDVPAKSISKEDSSEHFGFIAWPWAIDGPTSSKKTQEELGWKPTHPGLIADIEEGFYFKQ